MSIEKRIINKYNSIMRENGREYLCIGEQYNKFKTDIDKELTPKSLPEMVHEIKHLIDCLKMDIEDYPEDRRIFVKQIAKCNRFIDSYDNICNYVDL